MFSGIKKIFSEVPGTYDVLNRILTFGLDKVWRRRALDFVAKEKGGRWLDVCTGTAETAILLKNFAADKAKVFALDFSLPMLRQALKKPRTRGISFCIGNADRLPFADNTFELITISFATRNINIDKNILCGHFGEFRRVLKPQGKFINIETSQPRSRIIAKFFHFYVRMFVRPIGYIVSGSRKAYAYLSYTIPRFFDAEELSSLMYKSGFAKVDFLRLTFGICAVHIAVK